jgi:hypothetical protein
MTRNIYIITLRTVLAAPSLYTPILLPELPTPRPSVMVPPVTHEPDEPMQRERVPEFGRAGPGITSSTMSTSRNVFGFGLVGSGWFVQTWRLRITPDLSS